MRGQERALIEIGEGADTGLAATGPQRRNHIKRVTGQLAEAGAQTHADQQTLVGSVQPVLSTPRHGAAGQTEEEARPRPRPPPPWSAHPSKPPPLLLCSFDMSHTHHPGSLWAGGNNLPRPLFSSGSRVSILPRRGKRDGSKRETRDNEQQQNTTPTAQLAPSPHQHTRSDLSCRSLSVYPGVLASRVTALPGCRAWRDTGSARRPVVTGFPGVPIRHLAWLAFPSPDDQSDESNGPQIGTGLLPTGLGFGRGN